MYNWYNHKSLQIPHKSNRNPTGFTTWPSDFWLPLWRCQELLPPLHSCAGCAGCAGSWPRHGEVNQGTLLALWEVPLGNLINKHSRWWFAHAHGLPSQPCLIQGNVPLRIWQCSQSLQQCFWNSNCFEHLPRCHQALCPCWDLQKKILCQRAAYESVLYLDCRCLKFVVGSAKIWCLRIIMMLWVAWYDALATSEWLRASLIKGPHFIGFMQQECTGNHDFCLWTQRFSVNIVWTNSGNVHLATSTLRPTSWTHGWKNGRLRVEYWIFGGLTM